MQPVPAPTSRMLIEELDAVVWLFPVPRHAPRSALARARARALGQDLLRSVLSASAASAVPPESWRFASGAFGRPRIAAPASEQLRFSVSHSDGALAVAVSRQRDVGVDIEPFAPVRLAEIPWCELGLDERVRLQQTPPHERYDCFVRMWTLKEAFAKCAGRGAFLGFSAIETTLDPPGIAGFTLPVRQEDVEVGGRRHSLAVCTVDTPRAHPAVSRQYAARTARAGSPGPMS